MEIAELFRKGKPTSGLEFLCIIETPVIKKIEFSNNEIFSNNV